MAVLEGMPYIGRVPAYNNNIDPANTSGDAFVNRLKNNLTVIKFSPIGYRINKDYFNKSTNLLNNKNSVYEISSTLSNISDNVSLKNALELWHSIQSKNELNSYSGFKIVVNNDSTINETISNEYQDNFINNIKNMQSLDKVKKVGQLLRGGATSMDSDSMRNLLMSTSNSGKENGLLSMLAGQAIGLQTSIPQIWVKSDYNNTSSFTIKLVSPYGHPDAIKHFITDPLIRLVSAAAAVTGDGIVYGYPPLWQVNAQGLIDIPLGAITAMTITRGGQDTVFNRFNQPTNVDVRLTVQPIVEGYATALNSNLYKKGKMIVSNPNSIRNSFKQNKGSEVLDPIRL